MTQFTSGTQAIQGRTVNHDPEPLKCGMKPNQDVRHPVTDGWLCLTPIHDPRPEYAVLDNPILAVFRLLHGGRATMPDYAAIWLEDFSTLDWSKVDFDPTQEHIDHARRVLGSLAAVYS